MGFWVEDASTQRARMSGIVRGPLRQEMPKRGPADGGHMVDRVIREGHSTVMVFVLARQLEDGGGVLQRLTVEVVWPVLQKKANLVGEKRGVQRGDAGGNEEDEVGPIVEENSQKVFVPIADAFTFGNHCNHVRHGRPIELHLAECILDSSGSVGLEAVSQIGEQPLLVMTVLVVHGSSLFVMTL